MMDPADSKMELAPFFEMTPDLVCIAGADGFFRRVNSSVINKLEYSEEELFSRPIFSFLHPEDQERTAYTRAKMLAGEPLLNFENRYIAKSGKVIWLEWTSVYSPEQGVVFAIAKDVTTRKEVEKEVEEKYIRYKSLATHFKTSIEKDRKFLALELHEELAQLASVVKMDVEWIKVNVPELSEFSMKRVEHASVITTLLIKSMQRISFYISPAMLQDIGLTATLEWHCKEFALLNGIDCFFENAYSEEAITMEVKTDLFRICQEALTNIMYHAQANKVTVRIEESDDKIILSIIDDGKGFDIAEQKKTFGLINMHERAASINGNLSVKSMPGKGTRVIVSVPRTV